MWILDIRNEFSMSFVRTAATRTAAAFALATLAASCSTARCRPGGHLPVVRLMHLTAGDGPFITNLAVYDDGSLELQTLGLRKRCARDTQAVGRLLDLSRSKAFSFEASALKAFDAAPAESEQVAVGLPGSSFSVAIDQEPAAVAQFLSEADAIFRRAFGSRYDISLVPRPRRR